MKHWQELSRILDRVSELGLRKQGATLAIVTHIDGSAYRRPGAKLLIEESGEVLGGVSGGCIEADVCHAGFEVLETGTSRLLHYDTGDSDNLWGLGLGCEGKIDVLVLPIAAKNPAWTVVREALRQDEAFALCALIAEGDTGQVLVCNQAGRLAGGFDDEAIDRASERIAMKALQRQALESHDQGGQAVLLERVAGKTLLVEVLQPPPRLFVFGASDDGRPLVALASQVGFRVDVIDHRSGHLTRERFPEAERLVVCRPEQAPDPLSLCCGLYAVVKTHSFAKDKAWVAALLRNEPAYVGVLGPRARIQKLAAELGIARGALFGPIGLDLGADGPEQVAVSIVAELLAVRARRRGGHLRDFEGRLHAD